MRELIINALENAKKTGKLSGRYTGWKDNVITMEGTIKDNTASFRIERIWNGRKCSAIPVMDMPLTEEAICHIADLADENL